MTDYGWIPVTGSRSFLARNAGILLISAVAVISLLWARQISYLLFHSLVEIFSIIIAFTIFVLTWNARHIIRNGMLVLLGISFLFIGGLDLMHTLAFRGMGVFPGTEVADPGGPNLATQLWLAARYTQSISLVLGLLFLRRRVNAPLALTLYTGWFLLLILTIFEWQIFPDAYLTSLTPFKIGSEYVIILIMILGAVLLWRSRPDLEREVWTALLAAVILLCISELFFTEYLGVEDVFNFTGHVFKVIAFGFIYRAIIQTGFVKPQELLFRELTESERALRESEIRYRSLFESIAESFSLHEVIYDAQGNAVDHRFLDVNPAFEKLAGIPREQVIGKTMSEIIPWASGENALAVDTWLQRYDRVARTSEGEPLRIQDYDPLTGKYLDILIFRARTENGVPTVVEKNDALVAALIIDITEQHRSQQALLASEAQMRRLVDSNIIGIVFFDALGKITQANDEFLQITGFHREDLEQGLVNWEMLTPPEFRALDAEHVATAHASGGTSPYEKEYIRKDGSRVPILIGFATIEEGSARYVCFILDLTEQKKAEETARQYSARLEASNRELENFAFVASHDMQEPLRKIQAFGERLKAMQLVEGNELAQDYLERMLSASRRMRGMIEDLLALSRVTTRGQPFTQVDLKEVVGEVLSDLEVRIEATGAQIEIGNLPTLEADPVQLHQLLLNLIGNALKFNQPGKSPVVKIDCRCNTADQTVDLFVADNGIGFEQEFAERIFQPFQRLHGRGEYEGSGIGLAVCQKIVERHGGQIFAESKPGAGAVFTVRLPVHQPKRSV